MFGESQAQLLRVLLMVPTLVQICGNTWVVVVTLIAIWTNAGGKTGSTTPENFHVSSGEASVLYSPWIETGVSGHSSFCWRVVQTALNVSKLTELVLLQSVSQAEEKWLSGNIKTCSIQSCSNADRYIVLQPLPLIRCNFTLFAGVAH